MDRGELEGLDRESLVVRAQAAGIRRARILTRPELIDELLRLDPDADEGQLRKSRGFFGRARDLVARVVERGLHLPDAADRIRELAGVGDEPYVAKRIEPQAMPTVTLAEIYAAQGHQQRAVETLQRVLEREPEHAAARRLLARLEDEGYVAPAPPLPPEPEVEPALYADEDAEADADADEDEDADEQADEEAQALAELAEVAELEEIVVALDPRLAAVAETIETNIIEMHFIAGPSYEADGAEFQLEPDSGRSAQDAWDTDDADDEPDLAHAPTREPPPPELARTSEREIETTRTPSGEGARTYAIIAAEDKDVDALAPTGIVGVLPEAEEPDECFAIPLPAAGDDGAPSGGRMYVRWRVSFTAIGRQLGLRPHGRLVVRAHVVTPSWDGPRSATRDQPVDPDAVEVVLHDLPEPSVVRVAIGWVADDGFVPFAHSPALQISTQRGLEIWTPRGVVPVLLDDPRSASVARAFEASHRAASVTARGG